MDYQLQARRARLRLIVAGVVVASTAAAGGIALADHTSRHHTSGTAQPTLTSSVLVTSPAPTRTLTPATARMTHLLKPRKIVNGIGVGFEHSGLGAESAAVTYWQDLDILDTSIARRQWTTITSPDSPQTIDDAIKDIRTIREASGLPPTGGTPAGLTFTTVVNAVLGRSLDENGDVVEIWMAYDRFATRPGQPADDNPLTGQQDDLIVKWQDGDWKVTTEPKWTAKRTGPRTYDSHSPWAAQDGWREVEVGDA